MFWQGDAHSTKCRFTIKQLHIYTMWYSDITVKKTCTLLISGFSPSHVGVHSMQRQTYIVLDVFIAQQQY